MSFEDGGETTTDDVTVGARLDRLERLVERQQETIEAQRRRIERQQRRIEALETGRDDDPPDAGQRGDSDGETAPTDGGDTRADDLDTALSLTRRAALTAAGVAGLFGFGTGTAAADPQGQVGTERSPAEVVHTERLAGGLTGDTVLDSLLGTGLTAGTTDAGDTTLSAAPAANDHVGVVGEFGFEVESVDRFELTGALSGEEIEPGVVELEATDNVIRKSGGSLADDDGDALLEPADGQITGLEGFSTVRSPSGPPLTLEVDGGTRALALGPGGDSVLATGSGAATPNVFLGNPNNSTREFLVRGVTVGGGGTQNQPNDVTGNYGTIGGGRGNTVSASNATVGGGRNHTASGDGATVPGGEVNDAAGNLRFAAGQYAAANDTNAFVWNDGSGATDGTGGANDQFGSGTTDADNNTPTGPNTFSVKSTSGVRFITSADNSSYAYVDTNGNVEASGAKNFVETVSTARGERTVTYTALEAPTARTEVSGVATVEEGDTEVDLPEHFDWVTDADEELVVQVTAHADEAVAPRVTERSTDRIHIEDAGDSPDAYEVSWTMKGTREGYADKTVVSDSGDGEPTRGTAED